MSEKKDISSRKDIKYLVAILYERIIADDLLKHIFAGEFVSNMSNHLAVIADFWEDVLLKTDLYHDDMLEKHLEVNHIHRLKQKHFVRWLTLFNETVDEYFEGENSSISKDRAKTITIVMKLKIDRIEDMRLGFNN